MKKLEYPKCPYCGKRVSIWTGGYVTHRTEYKCEACERTSTVTVKHSVFGLIRVVFIVTILLLLFASFFKSFLEMNIIIIAEVICIALLPCYTKLVKKDNCEANKKTEENISE